MVANRVAVPSSEPCQVHLPTSLMYLILLTNIVWEYTQNCFQEQPGRRAIAEATLLLLRGISTFFSVLAKGLSDHASVVLHVFSHIFIPFSSLLGLTDKPGGCDGNTPPSGFRVSRPPRVGSASGTLAEQSVSLVPESRAGALSSRRGKQSLTWFVTARKKMKRRQEKGTQTFITNK